MPHSRATPQPTAGRDFHSEPLRLAEGVELLRGADNRPILYNATRGTYTRVSESGVRLLALLDGRRTGQEILDELERRGYIRTREQREAVLKFFAQLRNAGLLNVPPDPASRLQLWYRSVRDTPMLKLPLTHSLDRLLTPIGRLLRLVPLPVLACVLGVAALVSLITVAVFDAPVPSAPPRWGWVIALSLAQLACHELAHGVACRLFDVPIREGGVGLLYGVLPVAYIDYTDVYRLNSRFRRAAIALAGPASDALWAGITAALLMSDARTAPITYYLLMVQKLSFVNNLNPLTPSDGWQALEALMGQVNVRSRALDHLLGLFSREKPPRTARPQAIVYALYGLLYVLFAIILLASVFVSIIRVVRSL